MSSSPTTVSQPDELDPVAYYQLLWESGLSAFPVPGDLPGHLKPERIQSTLTRGREALLGTGDTAAPELSVALPRLSSVKLYDRRSDYEGWRLSQDNRCLVRPFVLQSSAAALSFAAFVSGIIQAAGALPALAVVLNTAWVILTTPASGAITEVDLVLARRLSEQCPDHPKQANAS
ncbi:MAG: 4a-hydroxytetrahydrobiopterin dehydratase [Acidobacteriota bacterium]